MNTGKDGTDTPSTTLLATQDALATPASQTRPRVLPVLKPAVADALFTPSMLRRLHEVADVHPGGPQPDLSATDALATTDVLLTGWGCPRIDAAVLDRAPRLRAIVHAAGTVKTFVTEEVFARGIQVSSAASANAVPVAEFTLATIILGAKRAFTLAHRYGEQRRSRDLSGLPWLGTHGITVGVVGASRIGRLVIELLHNLDAEILVHDPYLTAEDAAALQVTPCDMDTLCRAAEVVTLHAPDNPTTHHMLDKRRLALLRDGALVVNTSRGRLIDTAALTEEVVSGRLDAVLDVSDPEPPEADSPLYDLPNVFLTPHLAGAQGNEVPRLGHCAVEEIARLAAGRPMRHEIRADDLERIA